MAKKVIDITEKLSFDENPKIMIKGEEYEVNADAKTMLQIMGDFANKKSVDAALSAYNRMFSEEDRARIEAQKISFKDLMLVIETAMELIQGGGSEGEAKTHATT